MASFVLMGLALTGLGESIQGSSIPVESPTQMQHQLDMEDLTSKLVQSRIHAPEIYAQAVSVLEAQRTMPSCHRLAMSSLMDSCQSLKQGRDSEVELSEVRESFATRLAMCELSGAQMPPPPECIPFVKSHGCRKRSFMGYFRDSSDTGQPCFPEVTRTQLRSCLKVLNARPQLWTSYSNNLQNVLTVCQASRNAVEMENIISIFRSSADTTKDLTRVLADSLNHANSFAELTKRFQEKLAQDLESQVQSSNSLLGQLITKIQTNLHELLETITVGSENVIEKLSGVSLGLERVNVQVNTTELLLHTFIQILTKNAEAVETAHITSLELVTKRAQEVDQSLQFLVQTNIHTLEKFLQFHLEHLRNFTAAVQEGTEAMEQQINSNTIKLEKQAEKISQIGTGTNSFTNWVVVTAAFYQMARTWSSSFATHFLVLSLWSWTVMYLFPGLCKVFSLKNIWSAIEFHSFTFTTNGFLANINLSWALLYLTAASLAMMMALLAILQNRPSRATRGSIALTRDSA